jgi:gliding motility-associated-like protein
LNNNIISNPVASPTTTTIYRVIGTDSDNCFRDTADIPVRVYPIPQVNAGIDVNVSAGTPVRLNPVVSPDVTRYSWTPAFNLSCPVCRDPLVTTGRNMEFTLEVKNDGGCTSRDVISVFVTCNNGNLFIPNTFSPNGNGVNESFYPRGRGIAKIKSFRVFNRWGEVVFERMEFQPNDASLGWDGTFKGRPLGPDVFVYTCDVVCENNIVLGYKGDVTLLR